MNWIIRNEWDAFKKWASWDMIKALISGMLPLIVFFYFYIQWMNLVSPLMEEYSKAMDTAKTLALSQHDAIMTLCLLAGFIAPLLLALPIMNFGLWLGKATRFYRDDKTIRVTWDDKEYDVRNMPDVERKQISDLLFKYKSKLELRKENLQSKNWFWRNFG